MTKRIRVVPHQTDRAAGPDQKVLEVSIRGTDMTAVGCVIWLTRHKREDGKETLRIDVGNVREPERGRVEVVVGDNIATMKAPARLGDDVTRLRSALAEALLLTGGDGFGTQAGPLGRAHGRIGELCGLLGVTTDDFG